MITVTVSDDDGGSAVESTAVAVNNVAPTATISGPTTGLEGTEVVLTAMATDPSSIDTAAGFAFAWSITKDGAAYETGMGSEIRFLPADNGTYVVTLTATDKDQGESQPAVWSVDVANSAPTVVDAELAPSEINAGGTVTVTGRVVDPGTLDRPMVDIVWGDGGVSCGIPVDPATGRFTAEYVYEDQSVDETFKDYAVVVTATDKDLVASTAVTAGVRVHYFVRLDLSGSVFVDNDNDSLFDLQAGDVGIPDAVVQLVSQDTGTAVATTTTQADGQYQFDVSVKLGTYKVVQLQPDGLLDGNESIGTLGGGVDNSVDSNEIWDVVVAPTEAASLVTCRNGEGYNFGELRPSRIQGVVWEDFNDDGAINFGEQAIENAVIRLTGVDDRGNLVDRIMATDAQGFFELFDVRPSDSAGYTLTEEQPDGYLDGKEVVGTVNGLLTGQAVDNVISQIAMTQPGSDAVDYNFGERPSAEGPVGQHQTATVAFWQNRHGQNLIRSLNGGATSTQLGNWLAATFPNMYGDPAGTSNLAGKTNAEVALFFKSLCKGNHGIWAGGFVKLEAQVLATALAVYVTNESLAGATAASYGFRVTEYGVGVNTFDVAAAFGWDMTDGTEPTVMDLLKATNAKSRNGLLYDIDGNGRFDVAELLIRVMADVVYETLNEMGRG